MGQRDAMTAAEHPALVLDDSKRCLPASSVGHSCLDSCCLSLALATVEILARDGLGDLFLQNQKTLVIRV